MVTEIELLQTPNLIPLDFCLWIWIQREVYNRNIIKRDNFLPRSVYTAAQTETRKNAILAHESQNALKLTVGFSNFYCKLKKKFNLEFKLKTIYYHRHHY